MNRFAIVVLLLAPFAFADDRRAEVNYMLHCQGCHLPDASGFEGKVPPMKDFVGYFLHSQEGREFLIRVPGVAQSALDDHEIAELMNWLVNTYSAAELPASFTPFSADEIEVLRGQPVQDPDAARAVILARLAEEIPKLATDLENQN